MNIGPACRTDSGQRAMRGPLCEDVLHREGKKTPGKKSRMEPSSIIIDYRRCPLGGRRRTADGGQARWHAGSILLAGAWWLWSPWYDGHMLQWDPQHITDFLSLLEYDINKAKPRKLLKHRRSLTILWTNLEVSNPIFNILLYGIKRDL